MHVLIQYDNCPCCGSTDIHPVLETKDYTVSKQLFEIWHCANCENRFTQSVPDADNIGAFYQSQNYISHSDDQQGVIHQLYHWVRNYTLSSKRKLIQKLHSGLKGKLLDIGAGTGAFAITMQKAGWEVLALEPDAVARENALQKHGLVAKNPDAIYTLEDQQFDMITLWHVLEHVHDLKGYIQRCKALLKPGGHLLIAVPNYTSSDALYYGSYWAAWDVPRHLYHFSPEGMKTLITHAGMRMAAIQPMWFDAFYVSMLSEQYKRGKNNLIMALWVGFVSNCNALFRKKKCSSLIYIITG